MSFADYCLFAIAAPVLQGPGVTVSFACEFLDAAREGELVEGTGEITRAGGSMIFLRGLLTTGERTLFTFSGTIKRVKRRSPPAASTPPIEALVEMQPYTAEPRRSVTAVGASEMDVIEAIHGRRSVRSYDPRTGRTRPDRKRDPGRSRGAAADFAVRIHETFNVVEGVQRIAAYGARAMDYARDRRSR